MNMTRVARGDSRRKKLDEIRTTIAELNGELEEVAALPRSVDESAAIFMSLVRDVSRFGEHYVADIVNPGDITEGIGLGKIHTLGLILTAIGDEQIEKRFRELAATHGPGISQSERAERIGKASAKLRQFEVAEEREVLRLFDAGLWAERRAGVDVELVLSVWDE